MGHLVNPVSFRLGVSKSWNSSWSSNDNKHLYYFNSSLYWNIFLFFRRIFSLHLFERLGLIFSHVRFLSDSKYRKFIVYFYDGPFESNVDLFYKIFTDNRFVRRTGKKFSKFSEFTFFKQFSKSIERRKHFLLKKMFRIFIIKKFEFFIKRFINYIYVFIIRILNFFSNFIIQSLKKNIQFFHFSFKLILKRFFYIENLSFKSLNKIINVFFFFLKSKRKISLKFLTFLSLFFLKGFFFRFTFSNLFFSLVKYNKSNFFNTNTRYKFEFRKKLELKLFNSPVVFYHKKQLKFKGIRIEYFNFIFLKNFRAFCDKKKNSFLNYRNYWKKIRMIKKKFLFFKFFIKFIYYLKLKFYFLLNFLLLRYKKFFFNPSSCDKMIVIFKNLNKDEITSEIISRFICIRLKQKYRLREVINPVLKDLAINPSVAGFKIMCCGRFTKKEITTYFWRKKGSLALNTFKARVEYSLSEVVLKYSICGIKVWLQRKINFFSGKDRFLLNFSVFENYYLLSKKEAEIRKFKFLKKLERKKAKLAREALKTPRERFLEAIYKKPYKKKFHHKNHDKKVKKKK